MMWRITSGHPQRNVLRLLLFITLYMINNKRSEGAKAEKLKKNRKCFRIVKKGFEVMKSF